MARDKKAYLRKARQKGNLLSTQHHEAVIEVLVDILDVLDDCLVKLGDIEDAIKEP